MKKIVLSAIALLGMAYAHAQTKTFDLYVVAEGNFGTPNADVFKVSRIDSVTTNTSDGLYQTANTVPGFDVLQDFDLFGNRAVFACKPGGGSTVKLAVASFPSFDSVTTFTTTGGFQCLGKASNTKAYLSSATGNTVRMLDLITNTLTQVADPTAQINSYATYMVQANGYMYVAMGSKIVKIDTVTNTTVGSIQPAIGSIAGMVQDPATGNIWLLGKLSGISVLVKMEPANSDFLNPAITLTGVTNAAQLRISGTRLYFLSGKNVHIYNIASPVIPTTAVYTSTLGGTASGFAYGKAFAVDPVTGDFALGSANNYANPSLYEIIDGTTFQVIASGNVTGRIVNELILRTYLVPAPVTPVLPTVYASCDTSLTAPVALAGTDSLTATTTDSIHYNTQGTYNITWTYTNGYNTVTQTQTIIIDDTTAPVPALAVLPDLSGTCPYTLTPPTATDDCAGPVQAGTTQPLTYTTGGSYVITWTYSDGHGNIISQNQNLVLNCPTTIDDITEAALAFKVFPNPAQDNVYCSFASLQDKGYTLSLVNITGKEVQRIAVNSNNAVIPVKNLPAGIYFLSLKKDNISIARPRKVVIAH